MKLKEHCQRCIDILGKPFDEVHYWLDELANKPSHLRDKWKIDINHIGPINPYHRRHRHNQKGVEYIRLIYGDDAAKAAELHIVDDLFNGDLSKVTDIPADERDYVKKGFV